MRRQRECRHEPGTERSDTTDEYGRRQRDSLQADLFEPRDAGWSQGDQQSNQRSREPGAKRTSQQCERQRLAQKQADNSARAGAQGSTYRELALTCAASEQEQITDVEASGQQEHGGSHREE